MVLMESERLVLRDYRESDLDDMHRLWSDKKAMYYLDDFWCKTIDDTIVYLKTGLTNSDGHYFCICEKPSDRFIGSVGYTRMSSRQGETLARLRYGVTVL